MTNVFISSTGKDLAEYRQAAIEVCNWLKVIPIAMEYFEAMGVGATEGSKRKVKESDVYVGIFAHRYGYIEAGYSRSVTEIEFDYALDCGLDRLCFVVDPDYPWPPELVEYEQAHHLKTFKDKIEKSVIRKQFTTVESFKTVLAYSLTQWLQQNRTSTVSIELASPMLRVAPPRPSLLVGREQALADIKARFSSRQPLTIIRGWPGVGKTTLVNALAYDAEAAAGFKDGILWAALGEKANVSSALASWARQLGVSSIGRTTTLEAMIGQLRAALQHKNILLIVDDVWQTADAVPFKQVTGISCSLLITTRFGDIARELASTPSDIYLLGVLHDEQALELLRRLAPNVVQREPTASQQLVQDIEGLPLAIRVAARLLENEAALGLPITGLMQELRESRKLIQEKAPDDRIDPATGTTPTIQLLLAHSTDRLDPATREYFAMLGTFAPKPASFDLGAMTFVWDLPDPLSVVRNLVDRGLLEPIPSSGRFQMHAILVMHAHELFSNSQALL